MTGIRELGDNAAREVIIALRAKLKCERDKHYQEMRDASTRASECQLWLDELEQSIHYRLVQERRSEP